MLRVKAWFFFYALLVTGAVLPGEAEFDQGLLFRIQTESGSVSYLFGTIHSEDPRVTALPKQVRSAFEDSERLALEVDMNPLAILASVSAMLLDEGQELGDLVGDDLYARCQQAAADAGIPEVALKRYKPWAVAVLLSLPPVETGDFLDILLYKSAAAEGKQVVGLETVEEQIGAFDGLPLADQIVLLEDALDNLERLPMLFDALIEAYLRRDLAALEKLGTENFQGDPGVTQRFQESAIFSRNRRMVERLEPYLEDGDIFAAVGALHLPGSQGMLNLLRQRGYLVEKHY